MYKSPQISILLCAYNEQINVERAIQSIIDQTFTDWELVIIDDCSSDRTPILLQNFSNKHSDKIKIHRNRNNMGLAASLNKGIGLCLGRYIARMDADDWSYPHRLERQFSYMEKHSDIDVLGSGAELIGANGGLQNTLYLPESHKEIELMILKKTIFFHPSVMLRKTFFEKVGKYYEKVPRAEDIELWLRGLKLGCRYHNLPEILIQYSTGGYVRSYKSIANKFYSKVLICIRYKAYFRIANCALDLIKSLLTKFGIYVPRVIR